MPLKFERNWNVVGMGEPLLFPIKRAGQREIHLAKLFKEFFGFKCGKCNVYEFSGEIRIKWENNGNHETWPISENRGESVPSEARSLKTNDPEYLTLKDAELVESLKKFVSNYTNHKIDLAKIIGIGGEGTVLEEVSERLIIHNVLQSVSLFEYQPHVPERVGSVRRIKVKHPKL